MTPSQVVSILRETNELQLLQIFFLVANVDREIC
jgi:hypothetical protein